jgi:hypothetical protein
MPARGQYRTAVQLSRACRALCAGALVIDAVVIVARAARQRAFALGARVEYRRRCLRRIDRTIGYRLGASLGCVYSGDAGGERRNHERTSETGKFERHQDCSIVGALTLRASRCAANQFKYEDAESVRARGARLFCFRYTKNVRENRIAGNKQRYSVDAAISGSSGGGANS